MKKNVVSHLFGKHLYWIKLRAIALCLVAMCLSEVTHAKLLISRSILSSSTPQVIDDKNGEVTGVVTGVDGAPIPGVTVAIKGTSRGTVTDLNGRYLLDRVSKDEILVFSYIGMEQLETPLDAKSILNVVLKSRYVGLEEVVAIGYGSAKKSDLSSSIATINNVKQISSRPVTNTSDFLQGNTAGVTVVQQGGDPSKQANVVIRGVGSVNSESPLWVVDGMPYYGGAINPNDIESITILKDAASSSIYGAQASSGVIVVTTKSGKSGKPKVSVDMYAGVQQATNTPTPLTAEQQNSAYNNAADNSGVARLAVHDVAQNPWGAVTRTNWVDEIFRDAYVKSINIRVSGGGNKGRYMSSFNYLDKEGLLLGTKMNRFAFRMKSEYDLSDKISIGENIYATKGYSVGANTSSSYGGAIINAIYMPSSAPVYDESGNYHGVAPAGSAFAGSYGDVYNPVSLLNRPTVTNPKTTFNVNGYITYKPLKGLKFKSSYAVDLMGTEYKKFTPKIPESGRRTDMNYLNQSWSKRSKWIWDNQINYDLDVNRHHIDLTGVYTAQMTTYERNTIYAQNFAREESWYQYLSNAGEITSWSSKAYEDALISLIGRVRYDFDNRYFISLSIRGDRTSRLAPKNNSDVFSSISGAWRVSEESFMESIDWISSLKFRASWGEIGNIQSVSYYAYNVPMSSQKPYLGKVPEYIPGYYVNQQSNPDLKWERAETYGIGMDASLFNGKVEIIADYFVKNTKDMILTNAADPHTGVTNGPTSNVGNVINKGYEISLAYRNHDGVFKYGIQGNISSIKNKLKDLDGYTSKYIYHSDNVRSTLYPFRSQPGQSLYSYHLIEAEGIFQNQSQIEAHQKDGVLIQPNAKPGDLKFRDANGDGKISDGDRTFHGNAFPTLTFGLTLNMEYKNFDVSCLFQGVSGAQVFNGYKYSTYNLSEQTYNRDRRVLEAWSPANTNSGVPMIKVTDDNRNFGTNSTWYLEDSSYLRLKNLTVGYTLPRSLMHTVLPGSSLRVYATVENVFTITDYTGMDPEVGNRGLDVGAYPVPRTYAAGISFNF
ncbi:TonB-dependent receptor [Halosquirtibacter xylanolyticus]|uniref:SusC/RagA family TonB-linked outer membrane protein n=1 Tax=Halosquirtibacter xylanolyticus TaxID=3374599 RepID=UPI003749FBEF|nr:TonB-dependent receptor [Prolixibacteraceae bacterium]